MVSEPVIPAVWLSLFPGIAFSVLGGIMRRRPAWLANFLISISPPAPAPGELRWLTRISLFVGLSWIAIFLGQVFPFPHGQRPPFIPLLEVALLSLSAAALIGAIIWIAIGRRFFLPDRTTPPS